MAKSRAEMMKLLGKLLAEYAQFQRSRPDLPQGDLVDLSEREVAILVAEFQHDRAIETRRSRSNATEASAPLNVGSRRGPSGPASLARATYGHIGD